MTDQDATSEFTDLFGELRAVVETLQSETGDGASVERTLQFGSSDGDTAGVMGIRVQTGIGGITETMRERVESVQPEAADEPSEVRRPAVDVYEEDHRVRVVAELPGVGEEDLDVTVEEEALVLSAEAEDRQYWRAVSLPVPVATDEYTARVENGLVELVFSRVDSGRDEPTT
jgi:HSP20 family protein